MQLTGDDKLVFATEPSAALAGGEATWRVLVVDDEPDVYSATCMALRGIEILGRPLEFLRAQSAAEAFTVLSGQPDIAVVLLDVVMETESAGLDLVARIRGELGLSKPRIILRTGQPGYAPEMKAIRDYDINDYRIKSELTRTRLFTVLTAALRSYQTLDAVETTRADLEYLLSAQTVLLTANTLPTFALGVIERLAGLLGAAPEGLFCSLQRRGGDNETQRRVVAGLGRYMEWSRRRLDSFEHQPETEAIQLAFDSQHSVNAACGLAVYLPSRTGSEAVAFVAHGGRMVQHDPRVFDLFVQNTAVAADAVRLVERLREAAFVDGLTGLLNRSALADTIDVALRGALDVPLRLLLVDIDQFSEINETFGDAVGDALLRGVADRLELEAKGQVRVARVANDTFAMFGPRSALLPADLAERMEPPFTVTGLQMALSVSFGGVEVDASCASGGEAIKRAYSALKKAKHNGPASLAFYSPEVATEIHERTHLLHGLRQAFEQQRLFLAYQPLVDAASGRAVGIEALMRWRGDDGRMVPPDRFIPLAEQSGLIKDLGAWALHSAIQCCARLRGDGHALRVAVNVSMVQLLVPGFEAMVAEALDAGGLAAQHLEIEITESVAMLSPELVLPRLRTLQEMGVGIAIDDFGTGHSSLARLEKLAPERLKVDRAFIAALSEEGRSGDLAGVMLDMGKAMGLVVVAEGVETEAQRRRLVELGYHELQGYLFSPPLPEEALVEWLGRPPRGLDA